MFCPPPLTRVGASKEPVLSLPQPPKGSPTAAGLPGLLISFLTIVRDGDSSFCSVTNNYKPLSHILEQPGKNKKERKKKRNDRKLCSLFSSFQLGFLRWRNTHLLPGVWLCSTLLTPEFSRTRSAINRSNPLTSHTGSAHL